MKAGIDALLQNAAVWRAREPRVASADACCPTGWPRLDAVLPGGGWPLGTLTELLLPTHGIGELRLLLPALRALGERRSPSGWLAFIGPPHVPYPPALAQAGIAPERQLVVEVPVVTDRLWAAEQALRSGGCAAVLVWVDAADGRWLRRLKLAAQGDAVLAVALRSLPYRDAPSPATLRVLLEPEATQLGVRILKSRGRGPVHIPDVFGG
jgi:hypothetical protein